MFKAVPPPIIRST